ncbi:MAG: PilZ domain-containing protein [Nitrospirae bacterium]|nr:PilZ domain-containing protein [Nitrospirota bacterium]
MASQDPSSRRVSGSDPEAATAERRGRRLSLSRRLFFFGEDDFEGEATILDLSTGGCQATSVTEVQVGTVLRLSLFLQDQQWPVRIDGAIVRWVKDNSFGLEFTDIRSAQRERIRAIIMKAKL